MVADQWVSDRWTSGTCLPSWVLRGAPPGGRQEAVIGSNGTLHTDDGKNVALIGANVPFWIYK